ncbi:MAG: hypothetical protein FJY15_08960, partial [Bacteroidetes bacterium]|nr:hypothetical protein [Bacteroidota bacterium]
MGLLFNPYFCGTNHAPMKVIGIMSGTSMDGVDLALCDVQFNGSEWIAGVETAKTYPYNEKWRVRV